MDSTTSSAISIQSILKKFDNVDPDYRHMAAYDLDRLLDKPSFDAQKQEHVIIDKLLRALGDNSEDIAGLAMSCLAKLAKRCDTDISNVILSKLAGMARDRDNRRQDKLRPVARQAMKQVLQGLAPNPKAASYIPNNIISQALDELETLGNAHQQESEKLDFMSILTELLKRSNASTFLNKSIASRSEAVLVEALESGLSSYRKSATIGIRELVANLPDNEARGTLEVLVGYAVDVAGPDRAAHYLQAVAELASLATDRVSPFVTDMLPKLLSFLDSDNDSLRAVSLSAIEALVRYNTKQALPFVEDTAKKCLELLKYDPFYTYEDSTMDIEGDGQPISAESDDEFEGDDVNNDDEFEDDYAYDDGIDADDTSQKIRLGATKVLEAIVEKAVDICGPIAAEIGVGLTRHLIEHDDSTRMVIFNALTRLLQKANDLVASGSLSKEESQRVVGYWKQHASDVIKGLARSLRLNVKSIQAKQQAFAALSKLLRLVPDALEGNTWILNCWVPDAFKVTHLTSSHYSRVAEFTKDDLRLDALEFVTVFTRSSRAMPDGPALLLKMWDELLGLGHQTLPRIQECLLSTIELIIRTVRPVEGRVPEPHQFADSIADVLAQTVQIAYQLSKAGNLPIVRNAAISLAAAVCTHFNDDLSEAQREDVFDSVIPNIEDGAVRENALAAVFRIASTPLLRVTEAEPFAKRAFAAVVPFTRLVDGHASVSVLECIRSLKGFSPVTLGISDEWVVQSLLPILTDESRYVLSLAFDILAWLVPALGESIVGVAVDKSIGVLQSNVITIREDVPSVVEFFRVVSTEFPKVAAGRQAQLADLWRGLVDKHAIQGEGPGETHPHSIAEKSINQAPFTNISICMAALASGNEDATQALIDRCIWMVSNADLPVTEVIFHMQVLGHAIKASELKLADVVETLVAKLRGKLSVLRKTAAQSLGEVMAAYPVQMLELVELMVMREDDVQEYLVLSVKHGLKLLSRASGEYPRLAAQIWPLLMDFTPKEGKNLRSTLAKCFALLIRASPEEYISKLVGLLKSGRDKAPFVLLVAGKIVSGNYAEGITDDALYPLIVDLIPFIEDGDRDISTQALYVFKLLSSMRVGLLARTLDELVPAVHSKTKIDESLIRIQVFGPKRYRIDEGREFRALAYNIWYNLCDKFTAKIDAETLLEPVVRGLDEEEPDIRITCQEAIMDLCDKMPQEVEKHIDAISSSLIKVFQAKKEKTPMLNDIEQQKKNSTVAVQTAFAISKLKASASSQQYAALSQYIANSTGWIQECYKNLLRQQE